MIWFKFMVKSTLILSSKMTFSGGMSISVKNATTELFFIRVVVPAKVVWSFVPVRMIRTTVKGGKVDLGIIEV